MRVCSVVDCGRQHRGYGFCAKHYKRWKKHGDPYRCDVPDGSRTVQTTDDPTKRCGAVNCDRIKSKRGYCDKHYQRWMKHGDVSDEICGWTPEVAQCEVSGCDVEARSKGYCSVHWARWQRYGDPHMRERNDSSWYDGGCSIDGCNRKYKALGYCEMHYARYQRYGDPSMVQAAGEYCIANRCDDKPVGRGYCRRHYTRWQRYGDVHFANRRSAVDLSCQIKDCPRWPYAACLCIEHHQCLGSRLLIDGVCSVEDCDRDIYCYDLCLNHKSSVAGFGMSISMYENLLANNMGVCSICESEYKKPYIDHDHACCNRAGSCGECVRGVLCSFCNFGLGQFKDSIINMDSAITYLNKMPSSEDPDGFGVDKFELLPHRGLNKHSLSKERYVMMLDAQDWCCDICNRPFISPPSVDHNHLCCSDEKSCGQCVRGLLCRWCNNGLGYFRDRVSNLERAKQYLNKPYVIEDYTCDCLEDLV